MRAPDIVMNANRAEVDAKPRLEVRAGRRAERASLCCERRVHAAGASSRPGTSAGAPCVASLTEVLSTVSPDDAGRPEGPSVPPFA